MAVWSSPCKDHTAFLPLFILSAVYPFTYVTECVLVKDDDSGGGRSPTSAVVEEDVRTVLVKLLSIMNNTPQPLHDTAGALGSS